MEIADIKEVDNIVWQSIEESNQKKTHTSLRKLYEFLDAFPKTQKGDPNTNLIDMGKKQTYNIDQSGFQELFTLLDICRVDNVICHMAEKQFSQNCQFSGIMIDFDIYTRDIPKFTEVHCQKLVSVVSKHLVNTLDLKGITHSTEVVYNVFFITKHAAIRTEDKGLKWGLHMLIPNLKVQKSYKKYLMKLLSQDQGIFAICKEIGAYDCTQCLDLNSSTVPVLFLGSCKQGSQPYKLHSSYKVCVELSDDYTMYPIITRLNPGDIVKYNMIAELSLINQAMYESYEPLVNKYDVYPKANLVAEINDSSIKMIMDTDFENDVLSVDTSISSIALLDPEFKQIHSLLNLLTPDYYTDRNKWRDVIFALASANNPNYKQLAIWFSQKCPEKWMQKGEAMLEQIWTDAASKSDNKLTFRSIIYWAKQCNPKEFANSMERSYYITMSKFIYDFNGQLEHDMIATVLFSMLGSKYCTDVDYTIDGAEQYSWYEFIVPGQNHLPGELWKWRKERTPSELHIYMSDKFIHILDQIQKYVVQQKDKMTDKDKCKFYADLGKKIESSKRKLFNDTFKNGVIRQACYRFHRRGFSQSLNKDPNVFGVANGLILVGNHCKLIDHYHEYPITMFTPYTWTPFDETSHYVQLVLNAVETIIPEHDVRDWLLFMGAQGLNAGPKEGILIVLEGGGQNGKTTLLRWIASALGHRAIKFGMQLLCNEREDADKPNSALMAFKSKTFAYAEESNKAQIANVARIKEIVNVGEISARDLRKAQENFTVTQNTAIATQYPFVINTTDHGTWRRILRYVFKIKFRERPDPNNKYERQEDQKFNRVYATDPQFISAFLSILTHYYERLQNEFNGELKKVPCPTIRRESEQYRLAQDSIHRWISENIVTSASNSQDYTITVLSQLYSEWFTHNIDRKYRFIPSEVMKELESSVLSKYLKLEYRTQVLKGCRVLTQDKKSLYADEEFLSNTWHGDHVECIDEVKSNWWRGPEKQLRVPSPIDDFSFVE